MEYNEFDKSLRALVDSYVYRESEYIFQTISEECRSKYLIAIKNGLDAEKSLDLVYDQYKLSDEGFANYLFLIGHEPDRE